MKWIWKTIITKKLSIFFDTWRYKKNRVANIISFIIKMRKFNKKIVNVKNEKIIRFDKIIKILIFQKNVCVKCFVFEHIVNDKNVFCKNDFSMNVDEIKSKLVVLKIFWNSKIKNSNIEIFFNFDFINNDSKN